MKIEVEISGIEAKALSSVMIDVKEWLQNAISHRAKVAAIELIEKNTAFNPKKLSISERDDIIKTLAFETAAERSARLEAESNNL